jgi:hypothetical protein
VPLIAHAASVEAERESPGNWRIWRGYFGRDHPRLAIEGEKSTLREKACLVTRPLSARRPLDRVKHVEFFVAQP